MITKEGLTHHISAQFNAELEEVRSHLLAMGGLVEKQVNDAVTALIEADSGLAQQVREIDDQINQMERNIDEECLRILARRQPAASDLRLIISISKSVIDLERIGDEATKIARRAIQLCEEGEAAARLRRSAPHRRPGAQHGARRAGRVCPFRRRPGVVGGAVRQDHRPRVQDRPA